jgi:hypothetical protein
MAGSVNPKQIPQPDFRIEDPARQGQLTADLLKTRFGQLLSSANGGFMAFQRVVLGSGFMPK